MTIDKDLLDRIEAFAAEVRATAGKTAVREAARQLQQAAVTADLTAIRQCLATHRAPGAQQLLDELDSQSEQETNNNINKRGEK